MTHAAYVLSECATRDVRVCSARIDTEGNECLAPVPEDAPRPYCQEHLDGEPMYSHEECWRCSLNSTPAMGCNACHGTGQTPLISIDGGISFRGPLYFRRLGGSR